MPRANGITRQEILTSIKRHSAMTADELARELGISPVAVRQHLSALEAEGIITVSAERRGLGRPSHRYTLTLQGDEMFPRRYDALTNALLDELRAWQGEEAVEMLFERQRQRSEQALQPRLKDRPLAAQVKELAHIQTENGYMAELSEEEGAFRLTEHNCPYRAIVRQHFEPCCAAELALFRDLLPDAEIRREHYLPDGSHNCVFHIRPSAEA
jgi:iron-sulfur cluster biosynthesis transcriptional regulator SufR